MGTYIGQCDEFVNKYLAEGLQGVAAAAQQQHPTARSGVYGGLVGHPEAPAAPNHGSGANPLQWQQLAGFRRDQDTHIHDGFTSSKDSVATQQGVNFQPMQHATQRHSTVVADPAHAPLPKFTSAFSLPVGMIPTPYTAPMVASNLQPASMPIGHRHGQQMQPWAASSFTGAQTQLSSLQQAAQQQPLVSSLSAPAAASSAAAAAAASFSMRTQSQALSCSSTAPPAAGIAEDQEPDLSHLTVMQRYHARRKLAVQRMEREVEEKIAQLALLEQENRKLKWQAHILENMLLDIDKQLEVMASTDAAPDAAQWLTLLGMGQASVNSGRGARTVHRMLEGAGQVDVSSWSVQDCRDRWLAYLNKLRPLVEAADAAQKEYRSKQPASSQEFNSANGHGGRRPRRAAAAAAAAVIQQEAADVLGVTPVLHNAIPEPPAPLSSSPSTTSSQPPAADQQQQQQPSQQQQASAHRSHSSDFGEQQSTASDGTPASHTLSVEGIPPQLVQQIEQLVLDNFYWLLAMMVTNPVLTYEFISLDLQEGTKPLPPQEHKLWQEVVSYVHPNLDQLQECSTCIQVSRRCMTKVMEERAEIQESMHCSVESEMHTHLSEDVLQINSRDAAVDRMRANVRKESVVRNMVGFYCINVFSMFQLARLSLSCFPWFCMAWRVVGAMDEQLSQQLAELTRVSGRGSSGSGHNTRSSARLAAQR